MALIEGTDRSETLRDKDEDDEIFGRAGNDTIYVSLGRDFANGGEGEDRLVVNWSLASGPITFFAISGSFGWVNTGGDGSYSDSTRRVDFTGIERVEVRGGFGNDTIQGVANATDNIFGGEGIDTWVDSFTTDVGGRIVNMAHNRRGLEQFDLDFGSGDDFFRDHRFGYDDTINGGEGSDRFWLEGGRDFVSGGADADGDDVDLLELRWGDSVHDVTLFAISGSFAWEANAGDGSYSDSTRRVDFQGIERLQVTTGEGDDSVEGTANRYDSVFLGGGTDTYIDIFSASTEPVTANMPGGSGNFFVPSREFLGWVGGAERFRLTFSDHDDSFSDNNPRQSELYTEAFKQNRQGQFDDTIFGGDGNDTGLFRWGRDFFAGGDGEDVLKVRWDDAEGDVTFWASSGTFGWIADTPGQSYSDSLRRIDYSGVERVRVQTGSGDDYVQGVANAIDTLTGGKGVDLVQDSFTEMTQGADINLFKGGATLPDGSYFWGFEHVDLDLGSGNDRFKDWRVYDDTIHAGDGRDTVTTWGGRDVHDGGDGNDLLIVHWDRIDLPAVFFASTGTYGYLGDAYSSAETRTDYQNFERLKIYTGDGADWVQGMATGDTIETGKGADTLLGFGGNDSLNAGLGADSIEGGDGNDTLLGQSGADELEGGDGRDLLRGHGGNDLLNGDGGNDMLRGDGGQDTLFGGAGADTLDGGGQIDLASYGGSSAAVKVNLATGRGTGGDAAGDRLSKIEIVEGSRYDDTLIGGAANEALIGAAGDDSLRGGHGSDTLTGGAGNDVLAGEAGMDRFLFDRFWGTDTILGFQAGGMGEVIDLSMVTGITGWKDLRENHLGTHEGEVAVLDGSHRIVLDGVARADLDRDDFFFG